MYVCMYVYGWLVGLPTSHTDTNCRCSCSFSLRSGAFETRKALFTQSTKRSMESYAYIHTYESLIVDRISNDDSTYIHVALLYMQ